MDYDVLIVGAGVSGLSCARKLEQLGYRVLIVDRDSKVGGRIQTDSVDGSLLDRGFQVLLDSYKETLALCGELPRRSFISGARIWDGVRWKEILNPFHHPLSVANTLKSGVFSIRDIRALLLLACIRDAKEEESTVAYLKRKGVTDSALRKFFKPFFGGVFLDPHLQTSARVFDFTLRKFLFGRAQLPEGGMQRIPLKIQSELKTTKVQLQCEVTQASPGQVILSDGTTITAGAVVVATGAEAIKALTGIPISIRWKSASTSYFVSEHPLIIRPILHLNGSGRGSINSVAPLSVVSKSYGEKQLLSVATFGTPSEDEILSEFKTMFAGNCRLTHLRTYHIEHALPDYSSHVMPSEPTPGIFFCGDWLGVPSIETATCSGQRVAMEISRFLRAKAL